MSKRGGGRRQRKPKRDRSDRVAARARRQKAAADPQDNGSDDPEDEKKLKRVDLTPLQTMGVKLMTARELVKNKNVFIATQQISHSKKAQADAIRIKDLEGEVGDLTNQLMGAWNRAEAAENEILGRELGLPTGTTDYKLGEDGNYYYEVEEDGSPVEKPVPEKKGKRRRGKEAEPDLEEDPQEDEDLQEEDEETPDEKRARLMAELEDLEAQAEGAPDHEPVPGAEVPPKEEKAASA